MNATTNRIRRLLCLSVSATCAGLAGCHTSAERQAQRDPQIYERVLGAASTTRPVIGDELSLTEALTLANHANESLAISGEAYVRALLDRRRAVADFLPSVTGSASYTVREKVAGSSGGGIITGGSGAGSGAGGGVFVGSDNDNRNGSSGGYDADLNIPIDARWVLFDGFQNVNAYWRNVYAAEQAKANLLETQESLLNDVANVYYAVLSAESRVRVLDNSVRVQEERLRDIRGRQSAGVARPLDVAQIEAQVASTRVGRIEARRQVAESRALLADLLDDRAVEQMPLSDDWLPETPAADVQERWIDAARANRSALVAAENAVRAAERDVRVAIGAYYPSITLDLTAFVYRESAPTARDWESLLEVSFPLFSGGRLDADTRAAWSFLREANLVAEQSTRRVRREIAQAWRNLLASRERLDELNVQLAAAAEAFRQADAVYQSGRGTNLERVTAQDAQLQAELSLVTEQNNQKLAILALLRAAGVLRETLLRDEG